MRWNTTSLLAVTAVLELAAGIPLLLAPSLSAELLLGTGLGSPESLLVGRIAGAALLSIGLICWRCRNDDHGGQAIGVVAGLLVYNVAVALLLLYAGTVDAMRGIGIWPAIGLHSALSIWCGARLRPAAANAAPS